MHTIKTTAMMKVTATYQSIKCVSIRKTYELISEQGKYFRVIISIDYKTNIETLS